MFLLLFSLPIFLFGQSHSWDGQSIAPNAKIRCLNVFVNIIYDVHSDTNNNFNNSHSYWPTITNPNWEGINTGAIPTYLLDWMDTAYVSGQLHGTCTRLYGESSFDSLQITGDFVVVNLKESTVLSHGDFDSETIRDVAIGMLEQSSAFTLFGHYGLSDFYSRNVLIRNITKEYGGLNPGSGSGGRYTLQCVGDGDFFANPTCIVIHEVAHSLFGSNDFHTSGGNHRGSACAMPFLNIQCGYGLMGAAGSGLVCCNGYERWRMHWKHPQAIDYISARNSTNTQSVVSDITRENGNQTFLLRDFVTYGDVVRIKLPYKDSETSSNQYIWLENHQVGNNGKLDFLQYSNTNPCRPTGSAGIYAYYQIGRDVLEGTETEVWDSYHRDNLKIIPAEGYYDYELVADTGIVNCVAYDTMPFAMSRGMQNPLCGGQDQELHLFPLESDTLLYISHEMEIWRKKIGNQIDSLLPFLGDNLDAFSTHTKINMGTNPSTNNAKTYHSNTSSIHSFYKYIRGVFSTKNVQTTYLTGMSIEMTPIHGTGNVLVSVRWDDYDITNDTRWTGKIALKETAILTAGNTITLAQNRTVAQPKRDPETGLFAGRTRWTCENGSFFRQDSASALVLTENSSLVFESGSRYELSKNARVEVHAGCSLTVQSGAKVQLKGTVEVDSGGVLFLYDTAKMGSLARLIVRPGAKLVVDGGTLTSTCPGEMWQGIEVVGERTKQQLPQFQGTVELYHGATIENALCGIFTGRREDLSFTTTGGIIIATEAAFKNNKKSVVINHYAHISQSGDVSDYNASITSCTFTVDDNNNFSANNTSFAEHVRLWDVKGVTFEGCSFSNTTSNSGTHGRGIYAEDAGFTIATYCNTSTQPGCECPDINPVQCSFSGFTTAVEVLTTGDPYPVTVDKAYYSNNVSGIKVNGNNFATITRCTFNLRNTPEIANTNTGLVLNNCNGYTVEGNEFSRSSFVLMSNPKGITVTNSGPGRNSIYRNTFNKMRYGIYVSGTNGGTFSGLSFSCNVFTDCTYGIYAAANTSLAPSQGSLAKGADNSFSGTQTSSFYNLGGTSLIYYHSNSSDLYLTNPTGVAAESNLAASNSCSSTLCNYNGGQVNLAGFQSDMNAYTAALAENNNNDNLDNTDNNNSPNSSNSPTLLAEMRQSLSETYYDAVRAIMSDSLLDLYALEQWHTAAQPIADPYSLTETRFCEGYSETFSAAADDAELSNYAEFHALKLALRNQNDNLDNQDNSSNSPNSPTDYPPTINWYALTPAQIAQLQVIAERNTGRASVMAKGVLCFFFGICYEDEVDATDETDPSAGTRAKHTANDMTGDAALTVYPNPTDDLLYIELSGAGIASVALYDLQGRTIYSQNPSNSPTVLHHPSNSPTDYPPTATMNMRNVPAGVYVLHVTDVDGKEYRQKVVRR